MAKTSLSLLVFTMETVVGIVDEQNERKFDDELIKMTRKLPEIERGLYEINSEDFADMPISESQKEEWFKEIRDFQGEMPEDDFDIFVQLRSGTL